MQKEQIVGLAVRLFAVFLAIYTARYAGGLIAYLADSAPYKISFTFLFLILLFPIFAAILLWLFPLTIAAKLIPKVRAGKPGKGLNGAEVELVGFSILGLWVLATAIPDALHWTTFVYLTKSSAIGRVELAPDSIGNMVATVVELIIGFWLLLGSRGVVGAVRRLRYAGS